MKKYLVEFIGTFIFVLTIGMTVVSPGAGNFAPIAIGSALMIMVFAGGHVSGGHYNPAVTIAVWLRGRCAARDVPGYIVSQVLGAFAASAVVLHLKGGTPVVTDASFNASHALIAEFIGAFALCYVVLNVATAKATANNSFYGLAIGFTVMTMAFAFGSISGGAFNPAVAIGITSMGLAKLPNLWIYMVGNFGAAVVAAIAFRFINPEDK
ncbi:MAG: aquaporin [Planctomycetota bacterium]